MLIAAPLTGIKLNDVEGFIVILNLAKLNKLGFVGMPYFRLSYIFVPKTQSSYKV